MYHCVDTHVPTPLHTIEARKQKKRQKDSRRVSYRKHFCLNLLSERIGKRELPKWKAVLPVIPVRVWKQEDKHTSPLVQWIGDQSLPSAALPTEKCKFTLHFNSVESDLCKRLTRSSTLNEPEWDMCKCSLVHGLILFVIRRRSYAWDVRVPKLNYIFKIFFSSNCVFA